MREKPGDEARIRHISDAINNLENFTDGIGISDFLTNNFSKKCICKATGNYW